MRRTAATAALPAETKAAEEAEELASFSSALSCSRYCCVRMWLMNSSRFLASWVPNPSFRLSSGCVFTYGLRSTYASGAYVNPLKNPVLEPDGFLAGTVCSCFPFQRPC